MAIVIFFFLGAAERTAPLKATGVRNIVRRESVSIEFSSNLFSLTESEFAHAAEADVEIGIARLDARAVGGADQIGIVPPATALQRFEFGHAGTGRVNVLL